MSDIPPDPAPEPPEEPVHPEPMPLGTENVPDNPANPDPVFR